ncbi:alpha/beta hydrolase [Treponema sp. OttesenSCG-928-L16]|nr:alpha/beta hydrolase [Treponema sp. OttesenSCG-928-L16]
MNIALGVLSGAVILVLAAGYGAYRYIIVRGKDAGTDLDVSDRPDPDGLLPRTEQMQWLRDWTWEDVSLRNSRGALLRGYLFRASGEAKRTALCIHGYRYAGLKEYLYIARMYLEQFGMNVLIVDDYAHGGSEGRRIGFGWNDRKDCVQWAAWLADRFGPDHGILLHGISMGANTVINAAGDPEIPASVRWAVEDCGYSSAAEELRFMMKKRFGLPAFPLYYVISLFNKLLNGWFFSENDALRSAGRITVPMLFIHGSGDKTVPASMAREMYETCKAPKELLLMQDVDHAQAYTADPVSYTAAVSRLLEKTS